MLRRKDPRTEWFRALAHQPRMKISFLVAIILLTALAASVLVAQDTRSKQGQREYEARHAVACRPDAMGLVREHTVMGSLETDPFETSTGQFVVSLERSYAEPGEGMRPLFVSVEDERGRSISSGPAPIPMPSGPLMERLHLKPNESRYVVDAPPEIYKVSVDPGAWDKKYTLSVEDCGV